MNSIFLYKYYYFCIEFAGHAIGDEIAAEVPGGNVGQCSKFADFNEYCQENYNRIFGRICKVLSPGGDKFCLCKIWSE